MTQEILLSETNNGITTLTLNRPDQFNALSSELLDRLISALNDISQDESIRVVIIAGSGLAFCAGHDLKEMNRQPFRNQRHQKFSKSGEMMMKLTLLPQPVIARVHGMATAAGCQLVASCDLAIASTNALFAVSGVKLGLFCSTPAVALSRNISRKRALEMLLTGDFINADTAADYGLVNHAVEPGQLNSAVDKLAEKIASHPGRVVKLGKSSFYQQIEHNLQHAYQHANKVISDNMMLKEAIEGINAFTEKRAPSWRKV